MTHNNQTIDYSLSDEAIAIELGQRLEQLRLEKNLDQQTLADELGITRKTYRALVNGQGKVINLIKAMRILGALDQLECLLPATPFSPIERLKMQGKQRQRARPKPSQSAYNVAEPSAKSPHTPNDEEPLDW